MILERLDLDRVDWEALDRFDDRLVYQTREWLDFILETQGGEPVIAAVADGGATVGFFTGVIVRRYGISLLGSPLPGWTTGFMGFNLEPGVSRAHAAAALPEFAWRELGCHHLELHDRFLDADAAAGLGYESAPWRGLELDLRPAEDEIWGGLKGSVRTAVRKAEKLGVTIEEARDLGFADDLHAQIVDVFAKLELAPPWGPERIRDLIRTVEPSGRLLMLRARSPDGECVATALFPASGRYMHFLSSASWRQHQNLAPNEALMWYAIRYWKRRGVEVCDLGGHLDYKLKWRPREVSPPRLRRSRYRALSAARAGAAMAFDTQQRLRGRLRSARGLR